MRRFPCARLAIALSATALLSATAFGTAPRTGDERACERAWKTTFGVEPTPNCLKQAVAMRGTGAP